VHLRIVVTIFALLPYVLFPFVEGISVSPFGWLGGVGSIALAAWLSVAASRVNTLMVWAGVFITPSIR